MVRHGALPTEEIIGPGETSPLSTAPVTLQQDSSQWQHHPDGTPKASPMSQDPDADDTAALCIRVRALEAELDTCRQELREIQRRLSHSERLHRSTDTRNQELQRQAGD